MFLLFLFFLANWFFFQCAKPRQSGQLRSKRQLESISSELGANFTAHTEGTAILRCNAKSTAICKQVSEYVSKYVSK